MSDTIATIDAVIPLTADQEKVIAFIYNDAKEIIVTLTSAPTNLFVTVTKIIGEVIKLVEAISSSKTVLSGTDKKAVAIHVIRTIITDVVHDEGIRTTILGIFHEIVDDTIDLLIQVSHGLQAVKKAEQAVEEFAKGCCFSA
jgi:hypothetical protein